LSESRPELYARLERARDEGFCETLSIRFQADNDLKRIIVDATLRREPGNRFSECPSRPIGRSRR
jgi:hypothetical protein